ncbi:hypothetical protein PV08_05113 [Exophiala spinifera]|uniref:beta-glucosidase n=1 Tax=Exophiala spinifera TaxID=91928 RepID=A0A0D2BFZ6_9EURO|nr:uncharacterized protein PV08_05113 [Exophiala spinifera]KIW17918.1 hypothetical protein PV08_05113 [Exophiala spinifera]
MHPKTNDFWRIFFGKSGLGWAGNEHWFGTFSTSEAIEAALNLEMPGSTRLRGPALIHAANKVKEAMLNNRVRNVLNLIKETLAASIPENAPEIELNRPSDRALMCQAAAEAIVLLKNE